MEVNAEDRTELEATATLVPTSDLQILTVPSSLAETMKEPSGLAAQALTGAS